MATVSILGEIPEPLAEKAIAYLNAHPDWNYDRLLTAALYLFLAQNSDLGKGVA